MQVMRQDLIAFDRAPSARTITADGHMRVTGSMVSKSNVCPYRGAEIPGWQELGLDANKVYRLYREPAALAGAAGSLNGKPLLVTHKPQTAADHDSRIVVGAMDNARWEPPYLCADLTIWAQDAIDLVESGEQRQLSCGYYYKPVMRSGVTPDGQAYDGLMTDIKMNHVALVATGRAGPEVMVGDSALQELSDMPRTQARAVLAVARETLGADATLAELDQFLDNLDSEEDDEDQQPGDVPPESLEQGDDPELGADPDGAEMSGGEVPPPPADPDPTDDEDDPEDGGTPADPPPPAAPAAPADPADSGPVDKALAFLKDLIRPEDIAMVAHILKPDAAASKPPPKPAAATSVATKDVVPKTAMDAAIKAAVKVAETRTIARLNAIRAAETFVRPWVGAMSIAQDSADGVYKRALETLGVGGLDKVHPSAYRAILEVHPKPGDRVSQAYRPVAMDSAASTRYEQRFPNAGRLLKTA